METEFPGFFHTSTRDNMNCPEISHIIEEP